MSKNLSTAVALRRTFQNLAAIECVLSPEWEYRIFSFDTAWAKGQTMGSIRQGSERLFVVFKNDDAAGKYIPDVPINNMQVLGDESGPLLEEVLAEPAFYKGEAGYAFTWSAINFETAPSIFQSLRDGPQAWISILEEYHDVELVSSIRDAISADRPLNMMNLKSAGFKFSNETAEEIKHILT